MASMTMYTMRKVTNYIAVHCAATPPTANIGVKEIRQWHRDKGWIDIGYHFVIRRDGTVETGRPIDTVGAHVENFNSVSVGISLVGGVNSKLQPEDNFTPAQYAALALKLRELKAKYPKAVVQGHRDFPNVAKACPSFDVRKWIAETGVFDDSHVDDEPDARAHRDQERRHPLVDLQALRLLGRRTRCGQPWHRREDPQGRQHPPPPGVITPHLSISKPSA
jgi:N-acetyl-anhydromuramyl-L-alanine amidase AmpD